MKFEQKYPDAKENTLYEYGNYLWNPKADNCYICGRLTHFVEVNMKAYLCSEECDEQFFNMMFSNTTTEYFNLEED